MADTKITDLTIVTPIAETDIFPVVVNPGSSPATKKVTAKTILDTRLNYSIVAAGDFALAASTSAQSAFSTAGDTFTLAALTTYEFEGQYRITKTTASTTIAMLFALGATITSVTYSTIAVSSAANTTSTAQDMTSVTQAAATVVTAASTGEVFIKFKGIMRVNAAGTVVPQIQFSAAPTTPVMKADSYIKFTPIGTNTENQKGIVS